MSFLRLCGFTLRLTAGLSDLFRSPPELTGFWLMGENRIVQRWFCRSDLFSAAGGRLRPVVIWLQLNIILPQCLHGFFKCRLILCRCMFHQLFNSF